MLIVLMGLAMIFGAAAALIFDLNKVWVVYVLNSRFKKWLRKFKEDPCEIEEEFGLYIGDLKDTSYSSERGLRLRSGSVPDMHIPNRTVSRPLYQQSPNVSPVPGNTTEYPQMVRAEQSSPEMPNHGRFVDRDLTLPPPLPQEYQLDERSSFNFPDAQFAERGGRRRPRSPILQSGLNLLVPAFDWIDNSTSGEETCRELPTPPACHAVRKQSFRVLDQGISPLPCLNSVDEQKPNLQTFVCQPEYAYHDPELVADQEDVEQPFGNIVEKDQPFVDIARKVLLPYPDPVAVAAAIRLRGHGSGGQYPKGKSPRKLQLERSQSVDLDTDAQAANPAALKLRQMEAQDDSGFRNLAHAESKIQGGLKHSSPLFGKRKLLRSPDAGNRPWSLLDQNSDEDPSSTEAKPNCAPEIVQQGGQKPMETIKQDSPPNSKVPDHTVACHWEIDFKDIQIQEIIGGGGFGQVYKAKWRETTVAVKMLLAQAQLDDDVVRDFKAEVAILAGLRHPNICLFMGACLVPPHRAIVTELVTRGSLWDALRTLHPRREAREAYLTPPDAWPWSIIQKIAYDTSCGMAYLHSNAPPILHRDLKSANLLLDRSYTVKLADFGLARLKAFTKTMTGNCGTVQWMAPEVLANSKYQESADVFSFAIVCWEMLSRVCPYEGMSQIQVAMAVLNHSLRPKIPGWCPAHFRDMIESCWKQAPEERPSFKEVLALIEM